MRRRKDRNRKSFREKDYADIPRQLLEHAEDVNMLKSIVTYAKQADVGIEDMSFEIKNEEISAYESMPGNLPEGMVMALRQFAAALKDSSETQEKAKYKSALVDDNWLCGILVFASL